MKKTDLLTVTLLITIVLIIFYPIFFARYVYTDEAVQLWFYRKGSGYQMFAGQGRYITEKLFQWLFSSIHTISEISYLRIFSLLGWIFCIPVWYFAIKSIVAKEGLPSQLTFFSLVYLIAMPPFATYISWASVMELFLANTTGLLSGYFLYTGVRYGQEKISFSYTHIFLSILFGCISLFTYQNGFGCFLLPFLLQLIAKPGAIKKMAIAVGVYFLIYVIYYGAFQLLLMLNHMQASERTGLHINVGNKLPFFIARPLGSAFHFTYLFNEKSIAGFVVYIFFASAWLLVYIFRQRKKDSKLIDCIKYLLIVFCTLGLIYLPSLIVKENYSSNRTLFALNLGVFFLVADNLLSVIKSEKTKNAAIVIVSLLFVVNAWFNFNKQYLEPVAKEYAQMRNFIETKYHPGIDSVFFIRPPEDFFVKKYGITRSWDEFGVPSTFFEWTPEFLVKQVVFEKTGDRNTAEKLVVKTSLVKEELLKTGDSVSQKAMIIDGPLILSHD